jgi:hypothetical protein
VTGPLPVAFVTSLVLMAGLSLAVALRADAATPASATITPDSGPVSWQGQFYPAGGNTSNFAGDQKCSPSYPGGPDDPGAVPGVHECDVFELTVDVPDGYWLSRSGGARIDIQWASARNDFDMYVYEKPPPGEPVGAPIASSAQGDTNEEHVILSRAEGTYLVRVNPFAVAGSDYTGTASFLLRNPIPQVPGGLPQSRASQTGYLSYSEPHIAVNPIDSQHLVAGSKMYQNLPEYKFKIGTFVSFDGGQTWTDNGHLPGYPQQSGNEGDDYHITSDPWTAFDDEGNAYFMVLDSPPDSQVTGAGWGMNLHRSLDGGRSWSDPIPIEAKEDPVTKELLLSDKNTLTVDNTGPDLDGKTGNLYACWSEDAPVANLSVLVSRSTDQGKTWSQGMPVSGADQSVIGCFLAVGPPENEGDLGVVYVFWLDFSGDGAIRMANSTDGGESFSPPSTVAEIHQIPRLFPNSAFRNLSIPWATVDPRDGTVYVTWADYHNTVSEEECPEGVEEPAPGQVCDADILMVRSSDQGDNWSRKIRVNQDPIGNGKDQFQQAVEVTAEGQLNMMWFDRRNDPQNFYIDTYFARSNDRGNSWHETRVTRSMWDPSINPPISPSGEFIGDYQGLAATDCFAYPFWNDTTLANLDPGDPSYSPYQEVFSARIPNEEQFGGDPAARERCRQAERELHTCHQRQVTILGSHEENMLVGTRGRDIIHAHRSDDVVRGRGGNDKICLGLGRDRGSGAGGKDVFHAGGGRDVVRGGRTRDVIGGGRRRDKLAGGAGNDLIRGGNGPDLLIGGEGKDRCRGGRGPDRFRGCEKKS